MTKEEIQYDLLKTEFELTQRQMDKYDQMSMTTKAWAVTLWAASIGWAFQVYRNDMMLLGAIIVCVFWLFDSINKMFRNDYKVRRDRVAELLAHFFRNFSIPEDTVVPQLPVHYRRNIFKNFFVLHIALPYLFLCVISVALYVRL